MIQAYQRRPRIMIVRKIKTVFRYFVKGELLSLLYERLFVQTIPLFYGMMWLRFYGLVHTNLRVGKPISHAGGDRFSG